jgi:hypothetical protein
MIARSRILLIGTAQNLGSRSNRTVVLRYRDLSRTEAVRSHDKSSPFGCSRRVAYEAADSGLLSPDWPPEFDE